MRFVSNVFVLWASLFTARNTNLYVRSMHVKALKATVVAEYRAPLTNDVWLQIT